MRRSKSAGARALPRPAPGILKELLPERLKEGKAQGFVFIAIVIKDAIGVHIDRCR